MDAAYQRMKFTELRFEYYVSGRVLWFNDTMSIAAMLLGYAVELSLKYILIVTGELDKKLRNKHEHLNLYRKCEEVGAIPRGQVSTELLQYVEDMFTQRYPSQALRTSAAANDRGHAIGQSLDLILVYDDLVIQLDEILWSLCSDTSVLIGLQAAHFVNRVQGRHFFHCNVAALKNTETYRNLLKEEYAAASAKMRAQGHTEETISYNLRNQELRLETWDAAPASIWRYKGLKTATGPDFEALQPAQYAKDFAYPGRVVYPK